MSLITDIYKEYKIMPNLQMHQLRVAGVAFLICDSLDIEVDKESVVKACLLHDMGNIIKFNLDYFPKWNEPEGIDYWKKVQNDYLEKYGKNEHKANTMITKELNLSDSVISLVDIIDPLLIEENRKSVDIGKKICVYADSRVHPHGVASLKERSDEARVRYQNHPDAFDESNHLFFISNIEEIEKQIFSHSNIKPEDINDDVVDEIIPILKNYEI